MPNLENLKKQAKLVLRWHRGRYYPVAAQIRAILPRYRRLSDPEILAARFRLSDAQELVAKQQGFESWQALKTGADSMSEQAGKARSKPVIRTTAAQLFVSDIKYHAIFSRKNSASLSPSCTGSRRSTRRSKEIEECST